MDVAGSRAVHAGRPGTLVAPHPIPRHHQERGVVDEVEQIIEPAIRIVDRPTVQLGLDLQYPRSAPSYSVGHGVVGIHRRPPGIPALHCRLAGPLRHVTGFPALGLLRGLRPTPAHQSTTRLPAAAGWLRREGDQDGSHVHREPIDG